MLALTRKENDSIVIGEGPDQITIVITKISYRKVTLGIKAPDHIRVDRQEVREQRERKDRGPL